MQVDEKRSDQAQTQLLPQHSASGDTSYASEEVDVSSLRLLLSRNFSSVCEQVSDPAHDTVPHLATSPSRVKKKKVAGPICLLSSFYLSNDLL